MGWQPKVHFVAKRGYYVCRVHGKQHYLGKNRLDDVDRSTLSEYMAHLKASTFTSGKNTSPRKYANKTIRTNVWLAHRCLQWCREQDRKSTLLSATMSCPSSRKSPR